MGATEIVWPWLLATLVFLVLLGSGRTLRGSWLGRPPFGGGVALSVALGVMLFSLLWMGLGHFGRLRAPWPAWVLGLGVLLALPGLFLTWRDHRTPGHGLARGFGPLWFAGPAWLLLVAALVLSMVWITGAFGWEGREFLFERASLDWAAGATFFDPEIPRDPFLGDEPLDLWLHGLGTPAAALALSWWLGVAILFGVCGLGWRLHAHGAGLAAATLLSIVLFATDRPLFLAPALPATLALLAVMILAVESRGRPHLGRTLVAGSLGGFALISDLGAAAMLLPLLFFGPSWCKKLSDPGGYGRLEGDEGRYAADDGGDLDDGYEDEPKLFDGGKKWLTPARHVGYGLLGLSLPLVPWLGRSYDWVGDPWYGLEPRLHLEADYRFHDYEPDEPGFQPSFRRLGEVGAVFRGYDEPARGRDVRLQLDPVFYDYQPRIGLDQGPDYRSPFVDGYLDATEWGLGLGVLAALSPLYGWRRRGRGGWRNEPVLYAAPALLGYGLGAYLGDFELTHPSALTLLSVGAGSTLHTWRGCAPGGRSVVLGGTAVAGGLALGLSGASACGYWDEFDDYEYFPRIELRYHDLEQAEEQDELEYTPRVRYRWHDPSLRLEYRYQYPEEEDQPAQAEPGSPESDAPETDTPKTDTPKTDWEIDPGYRFDTGKGLDLRYDYRDEEETAEDLPPAEPTPKAAPKAVAPGVTQEDEAPEPPRERPRLPTYRPDIRRNY